MPSVVTANRLRSGEVVYLADDERWVRDLTDACVADSDAKVKQLEDLAQRSEEAREVISAYAMDVEIVEGQVQPKSVRETIRAQHGPSI